MSLFNINSPVFRFMNLLFDAMVVGLLWIITSVPIITIGTSTAAAYYVMLRRISDREQSIFKDYFIAFKNNFKYATILFSILALFFALIFINFLYSEFTGTAAIIMYAIYLLITIELAFVFIHAFPLMSRFKMKFLPLVKAAILIANKHLITTITHAALLIAVYYLTVEFPLLIFFAFGPYCWLSSLMLTRLYRKYRPEFDNDDENDSGDVNDERNG